MQPIIDFIVDGVLFGSRNKWSLIPRVGDTVLLKGGKVFVEVQRVIWGDDSATPSGVDRQWVQVLCKTIDGAPAASGEEG